MTVFTLSCVCDSNHNRVTVELVGTDRAIVRLVSHPLEGYVCTRVEPDAAFGDELNPSSWGWACDSWFGEGERFPDAAAAIAGTE